MKNFRQIVLFYNHLISVPRQNLRIFFSNLTFLWTLMFVLHEKLKCHRWLIVFSSQGREIRKYSCILTPWCNWRHSSTESPKSARVTHELCLSVHSQKIFESFGQPEIPHRKAACLEPDTCYQAGWGQSQSISQEYSEIPVLRGAMETAKKKKKAKKLSVVLMRLIQITCKPPPR